MAPQTVTELLTSLKADEMVNLVAGDGERSYRVQRALLTNTSTWFAKALSDRFEEGKQLTLRFPDTKPEVVEYFLHFLFRGHIDWEAYKEDGGDNTKTATQLLAIRLWVFGDEHFLPKLQNQAMKHLHCCLDDEFAPLETVREGLDSSSPGSVMRQIMMGELICGLREAALDQKSGEQSTVSFGPTDLEPLQAIPGVMVELAEVLGNTLAEAARNDVSWSFPMLAQLLVEER